MKIVVFAIFASGALVSGESGDDKVSADDLVRVMKKLHEQAEAGDANASYELWKTGRTIEKVDVLRDAYPIEMRLKFLRFAAKNGNVEANFKLFEYLSCDKKEPFGESRKWLEFAHQNGNNKASAVLALILGIDKKEPREALNVIKLAEDRLPQKVEPKDEFAESELSMEDFKRLRVAIQEGDAAPLEKAIRPAETEFEEAVEIWRMCNRSSDITLNLLKGKRFVSRQGSKLGVESDTEIVFGDNQKVSVVLSGVDVDRYEGTFSIDEKTGEIDLMLPKLDKPWPKMKVEVQNGRTLISRSDGQTSMTPDLKDAKKFENYWPFAEDSEK